MPSNFFFPKAIQVFPRLILVPRHYIVPIYIYYDNLFTYQAQCSSVTQMWQLRNPCECNIPKKSSQLAPKYSTVQRHELMHIVCQSIKLKRSESRLKKKRAFYSALVLFQGKSKGKLEYQQKVVGESNDFFSLFFFHFSIFFFQQQMFSKGKYTQVRPGCIFLR